MRGSDTRSGELFSYVDLEQRVPAKHPLRKIRQLVNDVLVNLDPEFAKLYSAFGRESIPPERLLRALLLQALFTIRSERELMEQLDYNLLFRWFGGSASTTRYGCRPCSRRTGTGCWTPMWPPSSWRNCWRTKRSATCCRSMAR